MKAALLVLSLLLACTSGEKSASESDATPTHSGEPLDTTLTWWYPDDDRDGYGNADAGGIDAVEAPDGFVASHDDCDDDDPAVHPDAAEHCNGRDDDCDDVVDEADSEDALTWYRDADGDGYGVGEDTAVACTSPDGHAAVSGDCDDNTAEVHPSAAKVCNGLDDDCDGLTDGSDAISTWYRDADGDGYGTSDTSISGEGCDAPAGYVVADGDCADDDPAISPEAVETCDNEVDEDCTGNARDCTFWGEHELAEAYAIYRGDVGTYNTGWDLAGADANGDGLADLWIGSPYGATPSDTGALFLVAGPEAGSVGIRDVADATLTVATDDKEVLGHANAGDIDGDGYEDLWAVVQYGPSPDWFCLVLTPVSGTILVDEEADLRWEARSEDDHAFTGAVDAGKDLDGDGMADAVSGDANHDDLAGAVVPLFTDELTGDYDLTDSPIFLLGSSEEELGWDVALASDSNGDGMDDVMAGAPHNGETALDAGAAYVLDEFPADGSYTIEDVAHMLVGVAKEDLAGDNVAGVGDLNDDGYGDLAIGARGAFRSVLSGGEVYVFFGPVGTRTSLSEADAIVYGHVAGLNASPVAGDEDVDGDGLPDLLIGGWGQGIEGDLPGSAWLVHSPPEEGTWSLADADATWTGEAASDDAGWAVALTGDTNGDGYADVLVGAIEQSSVVPNGGAAYLLQGGPF